MSHNPTVTILMPCFNGGPYLRETLKSLLIQSFRDFELLIINDCSTDDSLEVIRSFKDTRIRVHTNSVNIGQTKSLNVGLKLAKGKYVIINDADDLSTHDRIDRQLSFMQKNPDCAVAGSSCHIMDRTGQVTRTFHKPTDPREIRLQILSETPVVHGSVIMNREVILGQGGYHENFRICQDYELWSSLIRKGFQVRNLSDTLAVIRLYTESISFRESDAQTRENGHTIRENVRCLTGMDINMEEAIRQRMLFFVPERLSATDFQKAVDLFVEEYRYLEPSNGIDRKFIETHLAKRLMKPYAKYAIARLRAGHPSDARSYAVAYLRHFGFRGFPFLIWCLSFVGQRAFEKAILLHSKMSKVSVRARYRENG